MCKQLKACEHEHEPEPEPEFQPEPLASIPEYDGEEAQIKLPSTVDEVIQSLDGKFNSDKTRETYRSGVKRLFTLGECSDIVPCLKKIKTIIEKINNGNQPNGKAYSTSAKVGTFQCILFLLDNILTRESGAFPPTTWDRLKKAYKKAFDLAKTKGVVEHEEVQANETVPTFEEYFSKLDQLYPNKQSKEQIVTRLYRLFTVRVNFKLLKIISNINENDEKGNFILIPRSGYIKIIINDYKTKKDETSRLLFTFNKNQNTLSDDIKAYMETKKLKVGDYLFGKSPMSGFISKLNDKVMGEPTKGGINYFRHIRISETNNGVPMTYQEREKLSSEMGHSIITQQKYKRQLKIN